MTLPLVIVFTMLVVQYALVWHGRHVLEAAAQDGLRAGRAYRATPTAGHEAATRYLAAVAPTLVQHPIVAATRTATTVAVAVSGHVLSVIPFGSFDITAHAAGPVERYTR